MKKFEIKFNEIIIMWPLEIDITDGEVREDNGFYSENLCKISNDIELEIGREDAWKDMMVWAIYGVLHTIARESYINGIYKVYPKSIHVNEYKRMFYKNLVASNDFKDILIEFQNENKGFKL